jgi:hypothetical protein
LAERNLRVRYRTATSVARAPKTTLVHCWVPIERMRPRSGDREIKVGGGEVVAGAFGKRVDETDPLSTWTLPKTPN